jgi:hypothetical protein
MVLCNWTNSVLELPSLLAIDDQSLLQAVPPLGEIALLGFVPASLNAQLPVQAHFID